MEDEAVGDHLEEHLDGEDGGEEVVEVVQDLEQLTSMVCGDFDLNYLFLTLFLSDFESSGSSAANMAEETMMHTSTMLPK